MEIVIDTNNKADHYSATALLQKLSGAKIHGYENLSVQSFNDSYWNTHSLVVLRHDDTIGGTKSGNRKVTHYYPQDTQKIVDHFIKPKKEYIVTNVGDYKAEITKDGIKVGCQVISFEKFDEVANKLKDFRNGV